MCGQKSLRDLRMTCSGTALLLLTLRLKSPWYAWSAVGKEEQCTYDCGHFQSRSAAIEDEHWLDAVEEQLADSPEETHHMSVDQSSPLLVAHSSLKLIDPYTGVNGHGLPFHGLQSVHGISESAPRAGS